MDIYEEIQNEIMTMLIAKSSSRGESVKLYKPLLILSMLDYHLDKGDETKAFNTPTNVEHLVDFFTLYLENELIREETYSSASNIFKRENILRTIREHPLYHITKTKHGSHSKYFTNDLPLYMEKKPRSNKTMANIFLISVPSDVDLHKLCNIIRSACYERIQIESGIIIRDSIVADLTYRRVEKSKYYRVGQEQYRRKMLKKYNCKCAFCNFDVKHTLVASHAKPWKSCETVEDKLSENNGLLLCATHDKMFDQGYLTINIYNGEFILSNALNGQEIESCKSTLPDKLNIDINDEMKHFFTYHADKVFKGL